MAITHVPVGQIYQDLVGPAMLEEQHRFDLWAKLKDRKFAEMLDRQDKEREAEDDIRS